MTDVGEIVAAVLGGGGLGVLGSWIRERTKAKKIEHDAAEADAARGERTEKRLWQRLEAVEDETKRCHEERQKDREAFAAVRAQDRQACDEEVAAVRSDVHLIAKRLARELDFDDTTGRHELESVASRSVPPDRDP